MFGHLWVDVDDEDEDDEEFPVAPVVPEASSAFVSDCVVCTFVVVVRAGVLAALAIAAPPNPSPNAPETTAAAMSGFFIRIFQLLLSARFGGHLRDDLSRWLFDRAKLDQSCGCRVALL
jgi:hypothetical protein